MRNTIIRIIAFIFALFSICTFIIGSTLEGLATEWDFEGYSTFNEFYEAGDTEYKQEIMESEWLYYTNQNTINTYEGLVYNLENYNTRNIGFKLYPKGGDVVYDNTVTKDYSDVYSDEIVLDGYSQGEVFAFNIYYLKEFEDLFPSNSFKEYTVYSDGVEINQSYVEESLYEIVYEETIRVVVNGISYYPGDIFNGKNGEIFELNNDGNLVTLKGSDTIGTYILEIYFTEDAFYRTFSDENGIQEALEFMYYTHNYTEYAILISAIVAAISLFVLFILAGKVKGSSEIKLSVIDRLPLEVGIAINAGLTALIWGYGVLYYEISFTLVLLSLMFIVVVQLISLITIVVRLKSKTLLSNSITFKVIMWCLSPVRYILGVFKYALLEVPLILKASLILIVLGFMAIIGITSSILIWILAMLISATIFMLTYFYIANLKSSIKKISNGEIEYKTNTKYMILDFKEMAENLNKINEGLEEATQKKVKSERLKAELITNVSHDLKTPLTSIINYVDLIKKQDVQDEKVKEYIEVLDRQSQKLKRLTTDLVDASKINSGNVETALEEVSLAVILGQIEGEYKESLEAKNLSLITNYPNEEITVNVDGKHLNRIIDNLMINVSKYSMENTRVYLDGKNENGVISIAIKNTSKQQLNIPAEELMQRFVRGDESRHEEGNGLGLSIAQSLATVQGFSLNITVDGDLFKAEIVF